MMSFVKEAYRAAIGALPPRAALTIQHMRFSKRWPSIKDPQLFSDKLLHRKCYENNESFSILSDKVRVKEIVADQVGAEFIIPTIWSGTELPDDISEWKRPFVIKSNHSSGWNIFIKDDMDYDWESIRKEAHSWLSKPWLKSLHERWYNRIERKILVEPFIGDGGEFLSDYKLFCFNGNVEIIQVDTERFTDHRRNYYTPSWEPLSLRYGYPPSTKEGDKPRHLAKMIEISKVIGRDLPFARIDFYDLPEGPKFGEITFSPDAGFFSFDPIDYDLKLGKLWSGEIT